jgi:hypothetical protein
MTCLDQLAVQIARMKQNVAAVKASIFAGRPDLAKEFADETIRIRAALIAQGVPEGEL